MQRIDFWNAQHPYATWGNNIAGVLKHSKCITAIELHRVANEMYVSFVEDKDDEDKTLWGFFKVRIDRPRIFRRCSVSQGCDDTDDMKCGTSMLKELWLKGPLVDDEGNVVTCGNATVELQDPQARAPSSEVGFLARLNSLWKKGRRDSLMFACPMRQKAYLSRVKGSDELRQCKVYTNVNLYEGETLVETFSVSAFDKEYRTWMELPENRNRTISMQLEYQCLQMNAGREELPTEETWPLGFNVRLGKKPLMNDSALTLEGTPQVDKSWEVREVSSSGHDFLELRSERVTIIVEEAEGLPWKRPVYVCRDGVVVLCDARLDNWKPRLALSSDSCVLRATLRSSSSSGNKNCILLKEGRRVRLFGTELHESIADHLQYCSHWILEFRDVNPDVDSWDSLSLTTSKRTVANRSDLFRSVEAKYFDYDPDALLCGEGRINRLERRIRDELVTLDGVGWILVLREGAIGAFMFGMALPTLILNGIAGKGVADVVWGAMKRTMISMIDSFHGAAKEAIFAQEASGEVASDAVGNESTWELFLNHMSDAVEAVKNAPFAIVEHVHNVMEQMEVDSVTATAKFAVNNYDEFAAKVSEFAAMGWNVMVEHVLGANWLKVVAEVNPETHELVSSLGQEFSEAMSHFLNVTSLLGLGTWFVFMCRRVKIAFERGVLSRRVQWEATHSWRVVQLAIQKKISLVGSKTSFGDTQKIYDDSRDVSKSCELLVTWRKDVGVPCIAHADEGCWWCSTRLRPKLVHLYCRRAVRRFNESIPGGLRVC